MGDNTWLVLPEALTFDQSLIKVEEHNSGLPQGVAKWRIPTRAELQLLSKMRVTSVPFGHPIYWCVPAVNDRQAEGVAVSSGVARFFSRATQTLHLALVR